MRFFVVLLLVLLPVQFSWAAVGQYCAHEQDNSAQHFGHHVHKHAKSQVQDGDTGDVERKAPLGTKVHSDCGYCHLAVAAVLDPPEHTIVGAPYALNDALKTALPFLLPERPYRPQWAALRTPV